MSFGTAIATFWSKYAVFSGRARRSEFWFAQLFLLLVSLAIARETKSRKSCANQNSLRRARPLKTAYLLQNVAIAVPNDL